MMNLLFPVVPVRHYHLFYQASLAANDWSEGWLLRCQEKLWSRWGCSPWSWWLPKANPPFGGPAFDDFLYGYGAKKEVPVVGWKLEGVSVLKYYKDILTVSTACVYSMQSNANLMSKPSCKFNQFVFRGQSGAIPKSSHHWKGVQTWLRGAGNRQTWVSLKMVYFPTHSRDSLVDLYLDSINAVNLTALQKGYPQL